MKIEEDYVSYELAEKLKGLGFDWHTLNYYEFYDPIHSLNYGRIWRNVNAIDDEIAAPTLYLAQKWILDHGIYVYILPKYFKQDGCTSWQYIILEIDYATDKWVRKNKFDYWFEKPSKCLEYGLQKALKFIKP